MTSALVLPAFFPAINIFLAIPRVILSSMPFKSAISNRGRSPAGSTASPSVDSAGYSASTGAMFTAEDLEKNWDKISDFSNAKPFFNGGEQTGKVLEKAMKGN